MMTRLYSHDATRSVVQVVLFFVSCWVFFVLRARLQADGLSDAYALVLQGAGIGVLIVGALVALTLSRRPGSLLAAIVLRTVPVCLLLFAAAFAKTSYADVSIELEAIREARLPKEPETRIVVGPTGTDIRLSGEITEGAGRRLASLLDANPTITRIHLTSEGGLADEGQVLGDVIAARGLTTFVPDFCVSACTLAFVRGRERLMLADSRLGFHAPYQQALFGQMVQGDAKVQRDVYVGAGVEPDFADAALRVPSADIWIPEASRLIAAHVVTGIVDRFTFPDSGLDDVPTLAGARAAVLRNFAILEGLGHGSRVVDSIAGWYLQAYLGGRSEGEIVAGLRRIVGAAVTVALSRADDATLGGVAVSVARAMDAAPSPDMCLAIGTHVDLAGAARVTQDSATAALLQAASTEANPRPQATTLRIAQGTGPTPTDLGAATCADAKRIYAAMLARPGTVAATLRPIVFAEARKAADVLASMGQGR